jgi:hypothetical protein
MTREEEIIETQCDYKKANWFVELFWRGLIWVK